MITLDKIKAAIGPELTVSKAHSVWDWNIVDSRTADVLGTLEQSWKDSERWKLKSRRIPSRSRWQFAQGKRSFTNLDSLVKAIRQFCRHDTVDEIDAKVKDEKIARVWERYGRHAKRVQRMINNSSCYHTDTFLAQLVRGDEQARRLIVWKRVEARFGPILDKARAEAIRKIKAGEL